MSGEGDENGDENGVSGPIKSRWGMMTFAHSFNIGPVPFLPPTGEEKGG
jgi:hypothetical protein